MKRIVLISSFLFLGISLFAQGDGKVSTGIIQYGQQNYAKAANLIETGLSLGVKEKTLPKAYYNLALAYTAMARDSALMAADPDLLFKAKDAIAKTKETDIKNKYSKNLVLIEDGLHRSIFNEGAISYNTGDYAKSLPFLKAAAEMNEENVLYNLLLGYAQVNMKDSASAIGSLQKTLDIWNGTEAASRDSSLEKNILSTNLMLASLYNMYEKNPQKAIDLITLARKDFPTDEDLRNTELGIYQQNPQLFEQARSKFEKALKEDPKNNIVKLAFAQLLTQNDEKDAGLKLYNEVLESDPGNYQANVNIGAFFINEAVAVQKTYAETSSKEEDKLAELEKEFLGLLNKAYPHMQKAHEAAPENAEWINQLVIISTSVPELLGDAKGWISKQKALRGEN